MNGTPTPGHTFDPGCGGVRATPYTAIRKFRFRITGENYVVGWLALLFQGRTLTSVKRIRLAS